MATNRRIVSINNTDHDWYPTPTWATKALLKYEVFPGNIWEPACGDGAMAKVLNEYYPGSVMASDLCDRGYGSVSDFLLSDPPLPLVVRSPILHIITNPPFIKAQEFIERAHVFVKHGKICMFLRTAFMESAKRYEFFQRIPPSRVRIFTERITMYPAGKEKKGSGTTSYAWFIWDKAVQHKDTLVKWIEPGLKNAT